MLMRKRIWLSIRIEQLKRISPIIYFLLQAATFATVLFTVVKWRMPGIPGWFTIPILFLSVLAFGFLFAWVYYDLFKMREPEQQARFDMEPAYGEVLSPKEAWLFDALSRAIAGDESAHVQLREAAKTGRIPKEDEE